MADEYCEIKTTNKLKKTKNKKITTDLKNYIKQFH